MCEKIYSTYHLGSDEIHLSPEGLKGIKSIIKNKILYKKYSDVCHSARLAQRNLPTKHELERKGLNSEKCLKGGSKYSEFQNFNRQVDISQKYEKRPFRPKKLRKTEQQQI